VSIENGNILKAVRAGLKRFDLPAELFELEITEGTSTMERHASMFDALTHEGITVAVDDFGAGYSNLAVLRTIRPRRIKLDISLVRGIGRGQEAEALLHAALSLRRAFGASVLAEGVETAQQRDFLLDHGCSEMQGYLFSKPVSFENLLTVLQKPSLLFA
jgi:EAL domain-containing protein (putative c-di-GMP-specific phosphodiesterase class I)